jgi:hypothetical protein
MCSVRVVLIGTAACRCEQENRRDAGSGLTHSAMLTSHCRAGQLLMLLMSGAMADGHTENRMPTVWVSAGCRSWDTYPCLLRVVMTSDRTGSARFEEMQKTLLCSPGDQIMPVAT